jgi:hypothetical protein
MPSTRSFTPTRQGNPCLVCGNTKGRCRKTPESLTLCMGFLTLKVGGRSLGAKPTPITYQNLIRVIVSNPNIQSSVSMNPLKRLTQAENKSLIDQTKEVMTDKWCFKRKKTPTWKKEF